MDGIRTDDDDGDLEVQLLEDGANADGWDPMGGAEPAK